MAKQITKIGLNQMELTNNDLFVRKIITQMDIDDKVVVSPTHQAILIKGGRLMETLDSGEYSIFDKKVGFFKSTKLTDLDVELIYMSKTAILKVFWGTNKPIDFRDTQTGIPISIGMSGEFWVKVHNGRKFYEQLVGADREYTLEKLQTHLQGVMLNEIEPAVAKTMREKEISYCQISEYKNLISKNVQPELDHLFIEKFGLHVDMFIISYLTVNEDAKARIERELQNRIAEEKRLRLKLERARDIEETARRINEMKDKELEREIALRRLESEDKEKYLEVCKAIGWDPYASRSSGKTSGGTFCPHCGTPYAPTAKFCNNCGKKLSGKITCSCGEENDITAKFCSGCGKKL